MRKPVVVCLLLLSFQFSVMAQNHARFSDVKAGMHSQRLENEALFLANKKASTIRCGEVYRRAVIVSDGWEVERNQEGFIIGRHLHMELYGETKDGKCGMSHCVFRQRRMGDETFAPKMKLEELGAFYTLECE